MDEAGKYRGVGDIGLLFYSECAAGCASPPGVPLIVVPLRFMCVSQWRRGWFFGMRIATVLLLIALWSRHLSCVSGVLGICFKVYIFTDSGGQGLEILYLRHIFCPLASLLPARSMLRL